MRILKKTGNTAVIVSLMFINSVLLSGWIKDKKRKFTSKKGKSKRMDGIGFVFFLSPLLLFLSAKL